VQNGVLLLTFRDYLSVHLQGSSLTLASEPTGLPETSVSNYHFHKWKDQIKAIPLLLNRHYLFFCAGKYGHGNEPLISTTGREFLGELNFSRNVLHMVQAFCCIVHHGMVIIEFKHDSYLA
jgi:hypothetical protein